MTEAGELLRADAPGSLRHLVGLMSNEAYLVWGHAAHSIRTGKESFSAAFGKPYFEWLSENPSAADEFARGQAGWSSCVCCLCSTTTGLTWERSSTSVAGPAR